MLGCLPGCDLGQPDFEAKHGPPLHLIASYPADGQGTDVAGDEVLGCDSPTPDCAVPTDAAIELRFDRFLLPGGGLSLGLSLYSGDPHNRVSLRADYDVIERVVVFRHVRPLEPHALYTAEVVESADRSRGFWAFDGAALEQGPIPLRFSFSTGAGPRGSAAFSTASDTCETLAAGPLQSCAECHSTRPAQADRPALAPPMGLDLSPRGLFYTAIGHVAHQTETGNSATGAGLRTPARFGVQMSVIDPGNPATSYLLYKLLEKPENFRLAAEELECETGYHPPVSGSNCSPPDPAEAARLGAAFVLGEPMPRDAVNGQGSHLTHRDLLRVAAWISDGASCKAR